MPQLEVAIVGRLNNKAVVNEDGALLVSSTGGGGGGGTQYANGASAPTPVGNQLIYNESGVAKAVTSSQPLPVSVAGIARTPVIIRSTGDSETAISTVILSISIANVGNLDGTVTVGLNAELLKPGEIINYEAGGPNNYFASNAFKYTTSNTTFLITYITV
jgi:hypothetical protein